MWNYSVYQQDIVKLHRFTLKAPMDFHTVVSPVFQRYLKFGHKLSSNALFMTPLLHSLGAICKLEISLSLTFLLSLATVYIISLMVCVSESLFTRVTTTGSHRLLGQS